MRSKTSKWLCVHAYGEATGIGVWIECADCGLRRQSSSDTLPPCPSYSELTHVRAGWLMPAPPARHAAEAN